MKKPIIFSGTWLFLLTLITLFILFKSTVLFLPYFWDEAWSYIPAITEMARHSPCVSPDCIDPELYKGHPLLFYFISSVWMKYIHGSAFSMHLFSLIISVLAILSFYKLSRLLFPHIYVMIIVVLLVLQEIFIVQSSFVLPEVLIMLLLTEVIRNYLLKNNKLVILYLSLLGLVKEIGMVICISFIIYHGLNNLKNIRNIFWPFISLIPALIFFGYQKYLLGWFFYPVHIDLINYSASSVLKNVNSILYFLLVDQGRWCISVLSIILAIVYLYRNSNRERWQVLLLLGSALLLYFLINIQVAILGVISFLFMAYYKTVDLQNKLKQFIQLSSIMFVSILVFSSFNFILLRYFLCLIPVLLIMLSISNSGILLKKTGYQLIYIGMITCVSIYSLNHNFTKKSWHDDASMNYSNVVRVHVDLIKYCEQNHWQDKSIYTHFLLQHNMTRPELKYLTNDIGFTKVQGSGDIQPYHEIIIFSNLELVESTYNSIKNNPAYQLVKKVNHNMAWGEIYQRIN